jgi:hypothetical protein
MVLIRWKAMCRKPILKECEDETHTPEMGNWEPQRGLLKLQNLIARVKTPHIGVFFISLESYQSLHVENGLAWAILTRSQVPCGPT